MPPLAGVPAQLTSTSAYPLLTSKVRLHVLVPVPNARLTINGQATGQQGTDRVFDSPPMDIGKQYVYVLQATWTQDGREVTRKQEIDVQTGKEFTVVFKDEAELAPAPIPKQ
jgi:uncharacterized protein (TIGR03000 family)